GSAGVSVAGGATRVDAFSENELQNGEPDGIAILDTVSGTVVDALSYGGTMGNWPLGGITASAVATDLDDRGAESLCRMPNGQFTGSAMADFAACTTPSPGAANP
ncbi:MAG: hypothetical protein KC417_11390, partial [Myxococcales bacterium]|nr:hypothetical protein [Myxococcales bacterium]